MNILIVEDSAPVRRMIRAFVQPFTKEIFECEDGSEALAAYEKHRPDWVLMDIEMRHTDGITATRDIHTSDPGAQICIVTNYKDDDDLREAAAEAGAQAFISKDDLYLLRALLSE